MAGQVTGRLDWTLGRRKETDTLPVTPTPSQTPHHHCTVQYRTVQYSTVQVVDVQSNNPQIVHDSPFRLSLALWLIEVVKLIKFCNESEQEVPVLHQCNPNLGEKR